VSQQAETFRFAVDSALLSELGEKLVSTVHVALTELVKNAYDADATEVTVKITPEDGKAPRVRVEDNGVGMTLDEVRDFWMKIGTSNKVSTPFSDRLGRQKTGSKGVGRFACRRLGLKLQLTTTAKLPSSRPVRYQTTRVAFDWNSFQPGIDVETVESLGQTETFRSGSVGTTLEIWDGVADEWGLRGFQYLERQLALLTGNRGVQRDGYEPDPGFNVTLSAPGLSGSLVDLREAVIDASWGTLSAHVDSHGHAICSLSAKGLAGTKRVTSKKRFPHIRGARLRLGILPATKDETRRPELLTQYVLANFLNEWGGVHLRFNGFRVFPYGDDDWLNINSDRGRRIGKPEEELFDFAAGLERVEAGRALLNMLGMRNYIGQVEVTNEIRGLVPRIDRQGFIENEVFDELRHFARFAIEWASIYREHYIRGREHEEAEAARRAIRPLLKRDVPKTEVVPQAASYLRSEIRRIVQRLPPTQKAEVERNLIQTVRAIETANAETNTQLQHLRLIASASTLTLLFAHEVRTVIGSLGAASLRLQQLANTGPRGKELRDLASQLKETKGRFDNLLAMTGIVGAFRRTDALTTFNLSSAVERAVKSFHLVLENYDVTIDHSEVASDLMVGPIVEGELYTILLNLLSNAIKSVIAAGHTTKRIRFEAEARGKFIYIRVLDDGVGLHEHFFEEVFMPFIADPSGDLYDLLEKNANAEDAAVFGTGSGLGLSIARDIAQARGGDIKFLVPPPTWSACIEVALP
jgi:signal transduction histidine kinase